MPDIFSVNTASVEYLEVSTSLSVSESCTVNFVSAALVTGSFTGRGSNLTHITASFIEPGSNTTASFALTASTVLGGSATASFAISASYSQTASVVLGSITSASFATTASNALTASVVLGAITSASFATSASAAGYATTASYLVANLSAGVPPYQEGVFFYDSASRSFSYYNENTQMVVNVGQESIIRVYNADGPISNGMAVYLSGSFSGSATVWAAIADGTKTKHNVVGLATTTIGPASYGYVTVHGLVHGLSINQPTGSFLWLSSTASGSYVTSSPALPYEPVRIGILVESGSGTSTVYVNLDNSGFVVTSSFASSASVATNLEKTTTIWRMNSGSNFFMSPPAITLLPNNSSYSITYVSPHLRKIFIYGGFDNNSQMADIIWSASFDAPHVVGQTGKVTPRGTIHHPSNLQVIGDKIYFFGGEITQSGQPFQTASIWTASIYDPTTVGVATPTGMPVDIGGHCVVRIGDKLWTFFGINNSQSAFPANAITESFTCSVDNPLVWGRAGALTPSTSSLRLYFTHIVQIGRTLYTYGGYSGHADEYSPYIWTASIDNPLAWGEGAYLGWPKGANQQMLVVGDMHHWVGGEWATGSTPPGFWFSFSASAPFTPIFRGNYHPAGVMIVASNWLLPMDGMTHTYAVAYGGSNVIFGGSPTNGVFTSSAGLFSSTITQSLPYPYADYANNPPWRTLSGVTPSMYYLTPQRAESSITSSFAQLAATASFVGGTVASSSFATSASYASGSTSASYASASTSASYATTASVGLNFIANNQFSRGGVIYNSSYIPNVAANITIWRAPFTCTASAINANIVGLGGGNVCSASVNARKNGSSNLTASHVQITGSTAGFVNFGNLQNQTFVAGDYLDIMLIATTGSVSQIGVQVDFQR